MACTEVLDIRLYRALALRQLSQRWSCAAPDATVPVLAYRVLSFFF